MNVFFRHSLMLLLLTAALLSLAVRGQSAFAAEPVGELSLSGFRLDADTQALDLRPRSKPPSPPARRLKTSKLSS